MTSLYTKPIYFSKDFNEFIDDEYQTYINELSWPVNIFVCLRGMSKKYKHYVVMKQIYLSMYAEERGILFHKLLFKSKIKCETSFPKHYKHSETWEKITSVFFKPNRVCFTTGCFDYPSDYVDLSDNFAAEISLKAIKRIQEEIKTGEIFERKK